MNVKTLSAILKAKNLKPAEFARRAGISRQTVSQWFEKADPNGEANVQSRMLKDCSTALGISIAELMSPLPFVHAKLAKEQLQKTLLWDSLYPELEDFCRALVHHQPQALARLVQVYGLFDAFHLCGQITWEKFHQYKNFLLPVRKKECERLWQLQKNLGLI